MGDINNTKMAKIQNPCKVFIDFFIQIYPNIIQTICRSLLYPKTFKANKVYYTLVDYTNEFLSNIEVGLQFMYNINTVKEKANKSLNALIASQIGTINSQAETIAVFKQLTPITMVVIQQKKWMLKDPPIFSRKGTLLEQQANFKTQHIKIKIFFNCNKDYFNTAQFQILYILNILEGKAYKFIKQGLELIHKNPNNISIQKWPTKKNILKKLTTYYKVLNITQITKNKLNHFPYGEHNYQS